MSIPTPHIEMQSKDEVAKTVLMPGDPLRAKYIADHYLENPVKINNVRNVFGYTGTYKGKRISVFASGMGMPSIGIYSYELFKFYDVDNIIRIGSCGAYSEELDVYDVVLATDVWSESTYAQVMNGYDRDVIEADKELNEKILGIAKDLNIPVRSCRIHSSDVFYRNSSYVPIRDEKKCMAVEMEAFALFANARELNKKAACLLTVSDSIVKNVATTSEERQNAFTKMMEIALELAE